MKLMQEDLCKTHKIINKQTMIFDKIMLNVAVLGLQLHKYYITWIIQTGFFIVFKITASKKSILL